MKQHLSLLLGLLALNIGGFAQSLPLSAEKERERAMTRAQFTKNFKDIQTISQGLLREHEAKKLTPSRLAKDVKSINKCSKALRAMIGLGNLATETEINKEIDTPAEFDQEIRRLSKLVFDFAHNPVHQNSKVLNTNQAEQAQTDLLTIINLSKAIESRAKGYSLAANVAQ